MAKKEKCLIGYKVATINGRLYGHVFDQLISCCTKFRRWFENTGSSKISSFNHPRERERNGFNLVYRVVHFKLVIRIDPISSGSGLLEDEMRFCPFCGAEVEVRCTKSVVLTKRMKEVFDCYEEVETICQEKDGASTKTNVKIEIDHSRGLCGKPNVEKGILSRKEAETNPPRCLCCGSEMEIVEMASSELQQLGLYKLICLECEKTLLLSPHPDL